MFFKESTKLDIPVLSPGIASLILLNAAANPPVTALPAFSALSRIWNFSAIVVNASQTPSQNSKKPFPASVKSTLALSQFFRCFIALAMASATSPMMSVSVSAGFKNSTILTAPWPNASATLNTSSPTPPSKALSTLNAALIPAFMTFLTALKIANTPLNAFFSLPASFSVIARCLEKLNIASSIPYNS